MLIRCRFGAVPISDLAGYLTELSGLCVKIEAEISWAIGDGE